MAHVHRNERQIERVLDLASRLEGSRRWQARELAEYYGVHVTRIYEDLRILRRVCFLREERSLYWIEHGGNPLPKPFSPEEIQALTVALNASPVARETRFEKPIESVLNKLYQPLADHIQKAIEETDKFSIKIKSGNRYAEIEEHFVVLEQALHEERVVWATYQPGGKTEPGEHRLQPYAILFRKEDWYLFAHSNRSSQKVLPLKILRFKEVQLTDDRFEYPTDFSLDEELESMWELFGGTPIDIQIKIAAHKAYLVEEKQRHSTQNIIERGPDGREWVLSALEVTNPLYPDRSIAKPVGMGLPPWTSVGRTPKVTCGCVTKSTLIETGISKPCHNWVEIDGSIYQKNLDNEIETYMPSIPNKVG